MCVLFYFVCVFLFLFIVFYLVGCCLVSVVVVCFFFFGGGVALYIDWYTDYHLLLVCTKTVLDCETLLRKPL